jgi:hypothetical protein
VIQGTEYDGPRDDTVRRPAAERLVSRSQPVTVIFDRGPEYTRRFGHLSEQLAGFDLSAWQISVRARAIAEMRSRADTVSPCPDTQCNS